MRLQHQIGLEARGPFRRLRARRAATSDGESTVRNSSQAFEQALALHRAGQLEQAITQYRQAAERDPSHLGALVNQGIALKQAGRINEAIAAYNQALEVAPDFADGYFNLAILLSAVGRRGAAESAYRRAIALKPDLAPAHANLGNTLREAGRPEAAIESYRQAIALKPDHLGALVNLGATLDDLGRHDEAAENFRRALAIDPAFVPALGRLSTTLSALGRHDEAIATARRALQDQPASSEALGGLVTALKALGRDEEILAAYRTAVAASPESDHCYSRLAELHLERGEPAEVLAVCDACLLRHPGHVNSLALKCAALCELGDRSQLRELVDFDRLILAKRWNEAPGFASVGAFNDALTDHILGHPSLSYEPHGRATRLGRHTGELLVEPKGPIAAMEEMICAAVADYGRALSFDPSHPFLANPPRSWSLNVWAIVLEGQGYQVPHIHPSGWLSGVYYVTLPELIEDPANDQAGWIEFGQPLLHYKVTTRPEVRTIKPEPGLMLLFPSYFFHRTLPFQADATRISVAFDVMPVGSV